MRLLDVLKWMLAAGSMILGVSAVSSQEFPNKPIRIVAGAAGGGSDFTVRVLAVTSAEPSMLFPGVPTIAAAGLAGYETQGLDGIWAPALTPSAVIDRLNREIVRVLNLREVKQRFLNAGVETVGSSPEQLAVAVTTAITKTAKVIKDAGIRID